MRDVFKHVELSEIPRRPPGLGLDGLLKRGIPDGLILEFGVWEGKTITKMARAVPDKTVYGFDSFEGLPEDWRPNFPKGSFPNKNYGKMELPPNVRLVVGLFADTLPGFMREHPDQVAFVHIDSDLYSSAKTVLDALRGRFVPGTVLAFDELMKYPGCEEHEIKALNEFLESSDFAVRFISRYGEHQVAFELLIPGKES